MSNATYWHKHPRDFANECFIFRAATADEAAQLESLGFERLTRKEAQRHCAWLNAEQWAWGSNSNGMAYSAAALTDPQHRDHDEYSARAYLGYQQL
jgi:hypothetical protein